MRQSVILRVTVVVLTLLLLMMPALLLAQSELARPGAPPVGQPLVTEGVFAVNLGSALGVTTTNDEVEAESQLGELGIAPRNGWIADYPVTPDIIVELQNAVSDAVDVGRLSMGKDEALKKLNDTTVGFGLAVRPYTAGTPYEPSASCANYPNPAIIRNSYDAEGAPVVTYYCPPSDYYNLYVWVPAPFWWSDLWFPGFFILNDFHRVVRLHKNVVVVTNHFNEVRTHRAFRVDPVARFRGRTFAGIGVSRPKDFIPTGVPRSERTIFNGQRPSKRSGESITPPERGSERIREAPRGGERISPPAGGRGSGEGGRRR